MERKTTIILGIAVGVVVLGLIVGAVLWRRAALLRELEGGTLPSGQTGTVPQPGVGTGQPGTGQPGGLDPVKAPPPPGAAALGTPDLTPSPVPPAPPTPNPVDSDGDGLSNQEEQSLGTDPNNVDTDGDNLLDGSEVNALKTDPKVKNPPPARK